MQLVIVIILCIIVILCMWIVQYRPQPNTETKEGFKLKSLKSIVKDIKQQVKKVSGPLLKIIPPVVLAKVAAINPALKKEYKKYEKAKQRDKEKAKAKKEQKAREQKEREKREAEAREKKRIAAIEKTINKLMGLAPKYPESKYDIQSIVNGEEMNNFIHGKNIIDALRTYVTGPFTEPDQVVLMVKMLRESMGLTQMVY